AVRAWSRRGSRLGTPDMGVPRPSPRSGFVVRAARGIADRLKHPGFLLGTWEPRFERRVLGPGKPPSPATSRTRDGVSVVVRARESRARGEGRQQLRRTSKPLGQAMYVAPRSDWAWLQSEQRRLYERSAQQLDYVFRKLWGLMTDPRNLRMALARVARNKGRRTAGVDGTTVRMVLRYGAELFIEQLRAELRSGRYRPSAVRRVLIPKPGQPGRH